MPDKARVFIIAEAGSNWKVGSAAADLGMAKALIDGAKAAGADAVKFQVYRAETLYVPNAGPSDYLAKNRIRQPITKILKRCAMPYENIPVLAAHCRKKKIEFMASFFSESDFSAIDPFVRIHKIASYEITHPGLIRLAARSGKPLILSTGASTAQDIDWAVSLFKKNGGKNLALMQCTAKYPAPLDALNLSVIPALARRYGVPVGLSDHSGDPWVAPVAAVALGARFVEKHFTLDRSLKGPDHAFALTVPELGQMVRAVRDCEKALGTGTKQVLPEERELCLYAQRALQATADIRKGEILRHGHNFSILRPGKQKKGLHPKFIGRVEGKKSRRFIPLGQGIGASDCA